MAYLRHVFLAAASCVLAAAPAHAAFHLMQIEQIIGGVNGDVTAQAIQLRMRDSFQNIVSASQVRAVDATGGNSIILKDMTTDVSNLAAGARILITTPNFANYTNVPLVSDFSMTPLPMSYLAAGQVIFADDFGTDYWYLSWGGAGFTGNTDSQNFTNDFDGDFGSPVATALPSTTLQSLRFTGAASAPSTTNLADYAVTTGAATFVNNAGTSFTLVTPPPTVNADFTGNGVVNGFDLDKWDDNFGAATAAAQTDGDSDNDHDVDGVDFLNWQQLTTNAGAATATGSVVPELTTAALAAIVAMLGLAARRRRR